MKIWLLENGERTGPHEIYTIRDRISNEELNADTPAWYEGAEGWVSLAEVPAYSSYFKKVAEVEGDHLNFENEDLLIGEGNEDLGSYSPQSGVHVSQHEPLHPVRRFFARMLDLSLYTTILIIIKVQMGLNPMDIENVFQLILFQLPYIIIDGLALSYFGTTPGKWLLNIKLRSSNGSMLAVGASLIRSVRVWILGLGMQSIFIVVSLPFAWFIASKYGKFLWDLPHNNITECSPLSPLKIILFIGVMMGSSLMLQHFVPPELIPTLEDIKLFGNQ